MHRFSLTAAMLFGSALYSADSTAHQQQLLRDLMLHPSRVVTGHSRVGFAMMSSRLEPEPPFVNACVSTKTGNWNDATVWTSCGAAFPGDGDTSSIANTHNVTANVPTTVGASGNGIMSYVQSVSIGAGGTLGSGNCSVSFSGGSFIRPARASCTLTAGVVTAVTVTQRGLYIGNTIPTCTFSATGLTGQACGPLVNNVNFIPGDGTPAIKMNTTGVLTVASALTLHGALGYTAGNSTDFVVMSPGGSIAYDSHLAANTPIYTAGPDAGQSSGQRRFNASGCTQQSPCTITSTGGGLNGSMASGGEPSGNIIAAWTHFSNLGDAKTPAIYVDENSGSTVKYNITDSTFDTCGMIYLQAINTNATVIHNNVTHTNTASSGVFYAAGTGTVGTGARSIVGSIFDKRLGDGDDGNGASSFNVYTITDNFLREGIEMFTSTIGVGPTAFDRNFSYFTGLVNPTTDWTDTHSTDSYWMVDYNRGNPHMISAPAVANSFVRPTYEQTSNPNGNMGVFFVPSVSNPASGVTVSIANSIGLPSETGIAVFQTLTMGGSAANTSYVVDHATQVGGTLSLHPTISAYNENTPSRTGSLKQRSGLIYSAGGSSYYKMFTNDFTAPTQDVAAVGDADYNAADANLTLTQTGCGGCTNQGNGYGGKWSLTTPGPGVNQPGLHDVNNAAINFVDANRSVVLWDSKYKGTTAASLGGAAWVTSHVYSVGDITSDTGTIYSSSPGILYRCITAHTSGASTEPGANVNPATSTWRTYWQFYGVYSLQQDIQNKVTYTDASLNGCSIATPCGPLAAREGWIRTGRIPQDAALYKKGHDGFTIGAVDSPLAAVIAAVVN